MNKKQVYQFLKQHDFHPIKSFGQNFLINPRITQKIINRVKKQAVHFVEIGPGIGALTRHFEGQKKDILLIERDKKLAEYWKQEGWNVICADILKLDWGRLPETFSLFGNLPYEIAGSLIVKSCLQKKQISSMVLTMQKELAQRASAPPSSKNYGLLSVMSQTFWDMKVLTDIPQSDFYPAPKVEGRVLEFHAKNTASHLKAGLFLKFVKCCFTFKRKMLFKQIPSCPPERAKKHLKNLKLTETCRAEELSPSQFVQLYLNLKKDIPASG